MKYSQRFIKLKFAFEKITLVAYLVLNHPLERQLIEINAFINWMWQQALGLNLKPILNQYLFQENNIHTRKVFFTNKSNLKTLSQKESINNGEKIAFGINRDEITYFTALYFITYGCLI